MIVTVTSKYIRNHGPASLALCNGSDTQVIARGSASIKIVAQKVPLQSKG